MPTQAHKQIIIDKREYDALVHCAKVTKEYLQDKAERFDSAEKLIKNLKNL